MHDHTKSAGISISGVRIKKYKNKRDYIPISGYRARISSMRRSFKEEHKSMLPFIRIIADLDTRLARSIHITMKNITDGKIQSTTHRNKEIIDKLLRNYHFFLRTECRAEKLGKEEYYNRETMTENDIRSIFLQYRQLIDISPSVLEAGIKGDKNKFYNYITSIIENKGVNIEWIKKDVRN